MNKSNNIVVSKSELCDGEILINGYKHSMVQIFALSIALNKPVTINNAPLVDDTYILKEIVEESGGTVTINGHKVYIDPTSMHHSSISDRLSKKIHGSLYLVPAYGVRFGEYRFTGAGGCQIGNSNTNGARPVSQITEVMERFGIYTKNENDSLIGKHEKSIDTVDIDIMHFSDSPRISTGSKVSGATKTALLCSVLSSKTVIRNPYMKTDVRDLIRFMKCVGFKVTMSDKCIEIERPVEINHHHIEFDLSDCVSEVMTFIALAVHTNIRLELNINNIDNLRQGLEHELMILDDIGVRIVVEKEKLIVDKPGKLHAVDIHVTNKTIQSDHHPFFALILMHADSTSRITEEVWKERFGYVNGLKKLGVHMEQDENTLLIYPSKTTENGKEIQATDTRAAAILLLASLTVDGTTSINNIDHLHRGYENLIPTIQSLGADIKYVG